MTGLTIDLNSTARKPPGHASVIVRFVKGNYVVKLRKNIRKE